MQADCVPPQIVCPLSGLRVPTLTLMQADCVPTINLTINENSRNVGKVGVRCYVVRTLPPPAVPGQRRCRLTRHPMVCLVSRLSSHRRFESGLVWLAVAAGKQRPAWLDRAVAALHRLHNSRLDGMVWYGSARAVEVGYERVDPV
eukprot:363239-Chlamydomonas_euryale.AAC.14